MTWDFLLRWAAMVGGAVAIYLGMVAIWYILRNNYRARAKARLPETNCECGGCAVLKKEIRPIEGVHGVYDPRPFQRGATERNALSMARSDKAWLN